MSPSPALGHFGLTCLILADEPLYGAIMSATCHLRKPVNVYTLARRAYTGMYREGNANCKLHENPDGLTAACHEGSDTQFWNITLLLH
jgi:hypothetical protein